MNAIILAIGNELISGQSLDTNSAWLSRQLAQKGIATLRHETIGDGQSAIAATISAAAAQAHLVIVTGGLGPTPDDLTRQAVAEAMGVELVEDEASLREIEAFFAARNRPITPSNLIQATIPRTAEALPNSCGTAPGIYATLGKAKLFVTPGVPREMKAMYETHIAPRLPQQQGVILHTIVRLFGAGESTVGEIIADLMHAKGPVIVGTTVAESMISIRIISQAADQTTARQQADDVVAELKNRLGELVLGVGEEVTVGSAVGKLLAHNGQTIATAESCTGGLIGEMLTDIAGSSQYYLGGVIAYDNSVKQNLLGVPEKLLVQHGAVSEPVAAAMAEGVRQRLSSNWALATTGIAGPGGETDEKPVGLVYTALAGPDGTIVQKNLLPGSRDVVRRRAALTSLDMLRKKLRSTEK